MTEKIQSREWKRGKKELLEREKHADERGGVLQ